MAAQVLEVDYMETGKCTFTVQRGGSAETPSFEFKCGAELKDGARVSASGTIPGDGYRDVKARDYPVQASKLRAVNIKGGLPLSLDQSRILVLTPDSEKLAIELNGIGARISEETVQEVYKLSGSTTKAGSRTASGGCLRPPPAINYYGVDKEQSCQLWQEPGSVEYDMAQVFVGEQVHTVEAVWSLTGLQWRVGTPCAELVGSGQLNVRLGESVRIRTESGWSKVPVPVCI
jgi:hypothetical protein